MIATLITAVIGFGLGIWYSRGKGNPVASLKRDVRKTAGKVVKTAKALKDEWRKQ